MAIDINILSSLNEEQRNAVMDIYGPVMIIAGPGSGKTTCLVARTVYMLNNGINPRTWQVCLQGHSYQLRHHMLPKCLHSCQKYRNQ